jgi:hypothetical protein
LGLCKSKMPPGLKCEGCRLCGQGRTRHNTLAVVASAACNPLPCSSNDKASTILKGCRAGFVLQSNAERETEHFLHIARKALGG